MIMMVAAVAGAFSRGELESTEHDLSDFDSVRLTTPSVKIEVVETSGRSRIEATLDSRRDIDITERGGDLVIEVSRILGITRIGRREVVKLFMQSGATADFRAGSGSVEVTGLRFDELSIAVGSGSINVRECEGSMTIDVGSGSVRLDDVAGEFELSSGSGSLKGEKVLLQGDSSFDAGSGKIEMSFLNTEDELSFDLDAGSGSIRVGDIRGGDRVIIGSGAIEVSGNTGSGSQEYRFQ